jgi:hypothetical protein
MSDKITVPLTYGVFRPVILLPKGLDLSDEKQLSYILTHEFVHIRRFDALTKLVATAALCAHWFNPLVWVMFILLNRDIEISCDEKVVRELGETPKSAYARMLVGMAEKKGAFSPLYSSFSRYAIEERVNAIMKNRKISMIGIWVAVALVAGTITVFATSAAGNAEAAVHGNDVNKRFGGAVGVKVVRDAQTNEITGLVEMTEMNAARTGGNTSGELAEISFETTDAGNPIPPIDWEKVDPKIRDVIFKDAFGTGRVRLLSVGASDKEKFSPEEWEIILLAIEQGFVRWEIDNPGKTIDRASMTEGEHSIPQMKTYVDLSNGKFDSTATMLSNCQFYTNTRQIAISLPKGDYEGTFALFDVESNANIQVFTLDKNNRSKTFTNLTASANYYIAASGLDDSVVVTVTD